MERHPWIHLSKRTAGAGAAGRVAAQDVALPSVAGAAAWTKSLVPSQQAVASLAAALWPGATLGRRDPSPGCRHVAQGDLAFLRRWNPAANMVAHMVTTPPESVEHHGGG